MRRSRITPPPSAAAAARTSTPKRSSRFFTAIRPPVRAKAKMPTRSRASWRFSSKVSIAVQTYPRGVVVSSWRPKMAESVPSVATWERPMQDLRLIGVHEDGQHLLLADLEGTRFRVPLDESLRAAARRDRPRLGQLQIEMADSMRPREVQALIRAGASAEEVAERSGGPSRRCTATRAPSWPSASTLPGSPAPSGSVAAGAARARPPRSPLGWASDSPGAESTPASPSGTLRATTRAPGP